jgi:glycosyltransferase involved in cell wall biosynthesis
MGLLASARALKEAGWQPVVVLPVGGPLVGLLEESGIAVRIVAFPVARKSLLSPRGVVGFLGGMTSRTSRIVALLRELAPACVYYNTITIPIWPLACRAVGIPSMCHVHEAEEHLAAPFRFGLVGPLLLSEAVVVNSSASAHAVLSGLPRLEGRLRLVYNGLESPPSVVPPREHLDGPLRLLLVGRLSPRKGTDVALQAMQLLTKRGLPVQLDLAGDVFPGYEWFELQLRAQAARGELVDRVHFLGFRDDADQLMQQADIVLVPSRVEPFGNVAVEAMLAERPLIASGVQGLLEIVESGVTGWLTPPGDAVAVADAVEAVVRDWPTARARAATARAKAAVRFDPRTYAREIVAVVAQVAGPGAVAVPAVAEAAVEQPAEPLVTPGG